VRCGICRTNQEKTNTRIAVHKKNIKETSNHSVITEHRLEYDHEFDWENPKILDIEKHYNKRLLSEMINQSTEEDH